jgi:Pyroglutamyl peptidase
VLLTGFESYGGRSVNPTEEIVKRLDGERIAGVRVDGRTLAVSYAELRPRIAQLITTMRPRAVICLGLWPGEPTLRIERFAANVADFDMPTTTGTDRPGARHARGRRSWRSARPHRRRVSLAFYDALETNDGAVQVLGDETLRGIARELASRCVTTSPSTGRCGRTSAPSCECS